MAGKPGRSGRLPFVPTAAQRKQVQILKGCGWPEEVIARFFAIGESSLRKNFRKELAHGKDHFGCVLTMTVAQHAMNGKLAAAFFLLKTKYGWRENVGIQPLGASGEPVNFNNIDTESLGQLLNALREAAPGSIDPSDLEKPSEWPLVVPTSRTPN